MSGELVAISPIDGRYKKQVTSLYPYFSEYGLMQYRVRVEIEYFIALTEIPLPELSSFPKQKSDALRKIYKDFNEYDAQEIKNIEKDTNHDVKAVEYFIKQNFDSLNLNQYKEFIHFGLTSQDINNTSIPLLLKESLEKEYRPLINSVIESLQSLASEWKNIPMLARTHGQPASPTKLGKELLVFVERLQKQINYLEEVTHSAKFGGATGNFNAHNITYPDVDWVSFANTFVSEKLDLQRSQYTTQIEHYDNLAALFDVLKRINTIIIDLDRDVWQYISMGYFKQKIIKGEVGSSAMPHKVNPIDFENSEGNLGIANAIFEHLSAKLPISRLQRDLTDSTVLRNVGVPIAHTFIALKSLLKGLSKIELNKLEIEKDLDNNWAVIAEAIQSVLRAEGVENPYEKLKELTRKNEKLSHGDFKTFIETLEISEDLKNKLKAITPFNYTGVDFDY